MNFILTWTFRVNYFAAFDVFVAHYAFVTYRPASHFGFFYCYFVFLWQSSVVIPRGSATRAGRGHSGSRSLRHEFTSEYGRGAIPHLHVDFDVLQSVTLKSLHESPERATSSVTQASALGSSDSTTPRHPNLHHRRTQNRQVLNARHPVQLVLIQGFVDLTRESG